MAVHTNAIAQFLQHILIDKTPQWKDLLANSFCSQMATTKATDANYNKMNGHFKWYMVQDGIYLEHGVRLKLPVDKRKLPWKTIVDDKTLPESIRISIAYVEGFREKLTTKLGIPAATIDGAKAGPALQAYMDYLTQVEALNDAFAFNCAKAACQVSYELISKALFTAGTTAHDTLFWNNWILENKDYKSFDKFKELLDKDQPAGIDKPEVQAKYTKFFADAVKHEIEFWAAALNNTL